MISNIVLVLAEGFSERMNAARGAASLSRGMEADGRLSCDLCLLAGGVGHVREPRGERSKLLDRLDFDKRMRAARALVIACERLEDRTLPASVAFEAATRARQAGVPTYAVAGRDSLDQFEARIVDLQLIFEANTSRALEAAGAKLAQLV